MDLGSGITLDIFYPCFTRVVFIFFLFINIYKNIKYNVMIWMMDIMLQPAIKSTKYYKNMFTYKSYCEMIRRLFKWHIGK